MARYLALHIGIMDIITKWKPDEMAIEEPFFGKNVQSMLKLGRAQGIIIGGALHHGIPVYQYPPREVKNAVTGSGAAPKEQVARMLTMLLPGAQLPTELDATDALAVCICHALTGTNKNQGTAKKSSGWGAFIAQNPDRIIGNK